MPHKKDLSDVGWAKLKNKNRLVIKFHFETLLKSKG